MTCEDDYTLVVDMVEPDNYFLWTFFTPAGYVVNKAYFEEEGAETALSNPIGTGAFQFVSFEPGNELVVERFEDYWDPDYPLLDKITFKVLTDPTTILTGIRNNEIQVTWDVAIDQLRLLEDAEGVNIETTPGVQVVLLHMQNKRPPYDDVNVRRAIAEAIDMEEALSALYPVEYVQPSSGGFAAPGFTRCNISDELNGTYTGDIEKAKEYLAESAYPDGFDTFVVVDAQSPLHDTIALHIQERLGQIGINVEIQKVPTPNHVANVYSHDFDMNLFYWNANQNHILNVLNPMYHSNNLPSSNFAQFDNPEYDAAVELAYTTPDADEECEATKDAQRILTDQVPSVPLAYPSLVRISREEMQFRPLYPVFIWDGIGREANYIAE
jgi:peptide/nickel transport system substrate-binding protein